MSFRTLYVGKLKNITNWGEFPMSKFYKAVLVTSITATGLFFFPGVAEAISDIDAGGKKIHAIVVNVGKWVIIVKGTIDCVQAVLDGDFQKAKRQFFGYLMCFAIMIALPWSLDEVEAIFR